MENYHVWLLTKRVLVEFLEVYCLNMFSVKRRWMALTLIANNENFELNFCSALFGCVAYVSFL